MQPASFLARGPAIGLSARSFVFDATRRMMRAKIHQTKLRQL